MSDPDPLKGAGARGDMDLKVDELLASIRRTMDDDIDALGSSMTTQSRGTLMRGALREMRVSMGVEQAEDFPLPARRYRPSDEDLPSLRDRIRRNVEDSEILSAAQSVPPTPSQSAQARRHESNHGLRDDFLNIMALPNLDLQRGHGEEPVLRPSHAQDADDLHYAARPQWQPQAAYEPRRALMAPQVEAATSQAFQQLSDSILHRALGDRTLEEMARDMLRGQIKQWIDSHLPQLVEALVREEIERVARRGR